MSLTSETPTFELRDSYAGESAPSALLHLQVDLHSLVEEAAPQIPGDCQLPFAMPTLERNRRLSSISPPSNTPRSSLENKPRLLHSHSKQSVAASEDYYSVSERASVAGDDTALLHDRRRFSTPPSRNRSPEHALQSSGALETAAARHSIADERHFRRKAVGSGGPKELAPVAAEQKSLAWEKGIQSGGEDGKSGGKMDPTSRTYTPGQDDSQFIHFAIDQLTRDEEIRGSRHYAVNEEEGESSTSSEGVGAPMHPYQNWPTALPASSEVSRRAPTPLGIRVVPQEDKKLGQLPPRPIPDDIMAMPYTPEPVRREREAKLAQQKEMQAGPAPAHPLAGAPSASSGSLPADPESG